MNLKKGLFFGTLSLSVIFSATGAEQLQKDDFEAFVKRGYNDFLDRVGQEKSKELGWEEPVPFIGQGHEAIYQRFLNGALIYRPNKGSDDGMVTLPIRELANPLEGTFDLSQCGNTGNYLSISTGYRKVKKPENVNKVEIWFTPRFLIERELDTTAAHFKPIMGNWKEKQAPVGMFWVLGRWDNLGHYDSLITRDMGELSSGNLYSQRNRGVVGNGGVIEGNSDAHVLWARGINISSGFSCSFLELR